MFPSSIGCVLGSAVGFIAVKFDRLINNRSMTAHEKYILCATCYVVQDLKLDFLSFFMYLHKSVCKCINFLYQIN